MIKRGQAALTLVVDGPCNEIESRVFLRITKVEAHVAIDIRSAGVETRDFNRRHATQHSIETDFEESFRVERSVDNVVGGEHLAALIDQRHVGGQNFVEAVANSHLLRGSHGLAVDEGRLERIRVVRIQLQHVLAVPLTEQRQTI